MKNVSLIIVFTLLSFISSPKLRTIENEWQQVTKVFSGVNVAEQIKIDIIHQIIIPVQSVIIELMPPSLPR